MENKSNWHNAYPKTSILRYWILLSISSVPVAAIVILRLRINNRNSTGLPWSNKDILKSQRSDVLDVGYLHNFSLKYFSQFPLYVYLIKGISRGSTYSGFVSEFHPLFRETFIIIDFFLRSSSSRRFFCKVSYALCFRSIWVIIGLMIFWVNVMFLWVLNRTPRYNGLP